MASLTFVPHATRVSLGVGDLERDSPTLSFGVKLHRRESLELSSGGSLQALTGTIAVFRESEDIRLAAESVGRIDYLPSYEHLDASFTISVLLPNSKFAELLAAASAGRTPSRITVGVEGLTFGSAPDGSEMKWDNKQKSCLNVKSFNISVPLDAGAWDDYESEEVKVRNRPTVGQVETLAGLTARLARDVADAKFYLGLIAGLAFLGALGGIGYFAVRFFFS